jgi:hypothetical protein
VWGFELTIKVATLQGDSAEIAPTLNVKLWVLVMVACYPFSGTAEPNPLFESILTYESNFESSLKEPFSGISTRKLGSSEVIPFLRGEMLAIASLGCEGASQVKSS